jgi:hypothetical protein
MAVDWFADPLAWTEFLRAQGFSLGVGDELRVMLLLDELRGRSIPLPDVAETFPFPDGLTPHISASACASDARA